MRPACCLLFACFLNVFTAAPAAAGPLTGTVVDPDGRPIGGATVLLVRGSDILGSVATSAAGAFEFAAPDTGEYEVRIATPGLRGRPMTIAGRVSAQDLGRIALEVSAVVESVVVSAAQVDVPLSATSSSVSVLTGEDLQARQTERVADALRFVPGLTVAATGGRGAVTGVFPRGGESDYSLVVVDGVQANAFGGGLDFANLPVAGVDRIEIVRGPQSALYGANAIGTVIRVVSRRGGPPRADGAIEAGSFDTYRGFASAAGSAGRWSWGGSADGERSDGANGSRTRAGEVVTNDDYGRRSVAGGAAWSAAAGWTLRADGQYTSSERGFPGPFGSNPGGTFSGIDTVSRGEDDRRLAAVSTAIPVADRVRLQGHLSWNRLDSAFASPFGDSESWSRRTAGRVQGDVRLSADVDASAGFELQAERAGGTFITATGARQIPVERTLAGTFAELRWTAASRVFLTAGVRGERVDRSALPADADAFPPRPALPDDVVTSVNPKVAAAWFVRSAGGDFTRVRASAGTGMRAPDVFEIAFTDNPSLEPERSRSADLGLDHTWFDGRTMIELTGFVNRYDDLIVAVGSFQQSSRFLTDNISNARARGLEITGTTRARLHAPRAADLHLRVAYTLLDTEILAVDRGEAAPAPFTPGDDLIRRPRHQVAADVTVAAGRFRGFLEARGRGAFRDVDPSFGTFGGIFDAPGFAAWTAGASWRLPQHVTVFGRVMNLFDRTYEEALGFPAPGRGVYVGVRIATR